MAKKKVAKKKVAKKDIKLSALTEEIDTRQFVQDHFGVASFLLHQLTELKSVSQSGMSFRLGSGVHPNKAYDGNENKQRELNKMARVYT